MNVDVFHSWFQSRFYEPSEKIQKKFWWRSDFISGRRFRKKRLNSHVKSEHKNLFCFGFFTKRKFGVFKRIQKGKFGNLEAKKGTNVKIQRKNSFQRSEGANERKKEKRSEKRFLRLSVTQISDSGTFRIYDDNGSAASPGGRLRYCSTMWRQCESGSC